MVDEVCKYNIMETRQKLNINDVPLPDVVRRKITKSIGMYAANGIDISIVDFEGKALTVLVEQLKLTNGYILNNRQLYDRAKEVFNDCPLKVKIKPVVYSLDVNRINVRWIEEKMEEYGITKNDLIKQLAIDKSSLSLILSAHRELSKPMRATFFYYFLTYELNRDLREMAR